MSSSRTAAQPGILSAVLLLAVLIPPVGAQLPLDYHDALERARMFSPMLKSRAIQMQSVDALQEQAGRRPNPELDLDLENFSGSLPGFSNSETTIFMRQRFERGGKREARTRLATAGGSMALADQHAFDLELARDVAQSFAAGLAAQDRLALRRELLSLADEAVRSAEEKVAVGAVLRAEATRSRVTRNRVAIELAVAEQELELARRAMARLFGQSTIDFGLISGTLDTIRVLPEAADLDTLLGAHPAILKYRAEAQAARASAGLQRSLASQDLSLGAGFRLLDGADDGTFLVGLSMPLPLSDRNKGLIRAADISIEQAALAELAARNDLTNGLEQTLGRIRVAQSAVRGLRRDVLPSARASYDEVEIAYSQGRLTYLDLLEARRSLAESRLMEIDWLERLYSLRAELEWTTGRPMPALWEGSR